MASGGMPTFGKSFPPTGWKDVSQRLPRLFTARQATRMPLTEERRQQLDEINRAVHREVIYSDDRWVHGKSDHWTLPVKRRRWLYGDCEDFVLEKIRRLLDLGWPRDCLYMTFCRTEAGEWHLVLSVDVLASEASQGAGAGEEGAADTLILDNRLAEVRPWLRFGWALASDPWGPGGRWLSREGPGFTWQRIGKAPQAMVQREGSEDAKETSGRG